MALGILLIMFIFMAVISAILSILMFTFKSGTKSNVVFLLASAMGLFTTFINATSLPMNYTLSICIAWALGIPLIIGLVLKFVLKKHTNLANTLVIITIVGGMYGAFFS